MEPLQTGIVVGPWQIGIGIATILLVAGGIMWRIGTWMLGRIEKSIAGVNEKVTNLENKVDRLSSTVFELKGEVKGRAYAETEAQIIRLFRNEDRE